MRQWITAAILLAAFSGCGDNLPGDNEPKLELYEHTRLPENHPDFVSAEVEENRVIYTFASAGSDPDLSSENVIIGAAGGGYVRRATSVQRTGSQITVETEQASLTDAILSGRIADEVVSSGSRGWQDGCPEGILCKQTSLVDLSGKVLFDDEVAGVPVLVEVVEGGVILDPQFNLDLDVKGGSIARFEAVLSGSLSVNFEVKLTAGGPLELAEEIDLSGAGDVIYSHPFTFFVPTFLGPLPVVGRIDLDIFAGFTADLFAQASVRSGFDASAALEVGARYDGTEWTLVGEPSVSATARPVTFDGSASADIVGYVRPELRTTFYGAGGPGITLTPKLKLQGEYEPPAAPRGTIEACLAGELSFVLKIFSFELADYSSALERCTQIFEGNFSASASDPLVLSGDIEIDTDTGAITQDQIDIRPAGVTFSAGAFTATEVRVEEGARVNVVGSQALVLRSLGDATIAGTIDASGGRGSIENPGPGGFAGGTSSAPSPNGLGPGGGGAGPEIPDSGGGGGGHVSAGGNGGDSGADIGGGGGAEYTDAEVARGGSGGGLGGGRGGTDGAGRGGGGGGAVTIEANGKATLSGTIDCSGGPGEGGVFDDAGGGGGSGGTIMVVATTVLATGTLRIDGGGGGAGADGEERGASGVGSSGGVGAGEGSAGGGGGTATFAAGQAAPASLDNAGGGGGAAGVTILSPAP